MANAWSVAKFLAHIWGPSTTEEVFFVSFPFPTPTLDAVCNTLWCFQGNHCTLAVVTPTRPLIWNSPQNHIKTCGQPGIFPADPMSFFNSSQLNMFLFGILLAMPVIQAQSCKHPVYSLPIPEKELGGLNGVVLDILLLSLFLVAAGQDTMEDFNCPMSRENI